MGLGSQYHGGGGTKHSHIKLRGRFQGHLIYQRCSGKRKLEWVVSLNRALFPFCRLKKVARFNGRGDEKAGKKGVFGGKSRTGTWEARQRGRGFSVDQYLGVHSFSGKRGIKKRIAVGTN